MPPLTIVSFFNQVDGDWERDECVCMFLSFSDKSIEIPSMQIAYTFVSIESKEIIIFWYEGDIDELGWYL